MPVASRNTNLFSSSSLDQLTRCNKELAASKEQLAALIPLLRDATQQVESYTGGYQSLQQALRSFDQLQQEVNQRFREFASARSQVEQAMRALAESYARVSSETTALHDTLTQQQETMNSTAQATLDVTERLRALREELARVTEEADSLELGSAAFDAAMTAIDELTDRIRSAESELASLGRTASTQSGGFDPLREQIGRIASELPSLRDGVSQFVSAVASHLPELTARLIEAAQANKTLREANKGLAADQQKQVVPVWKQLLSAVTSWQTALLTGVSLVITYREEIGQFFSELFTGRDALREVRKASQELSIEVASEVSNLDILLSRLQHATVGTAEYDKARKELIDQYGKYLPNMESELTNLSNELELRNKLVTAIYEEMAAKKQESALAEARNDYFETTEKNFSKKLSNSAGYTVDRAFTIAYGEDAEAMKTAYSLALIGDTKQLELAQEIEANLIKAIGKSIGRGNNSDQVIKGWIVDMNEAASIYLTRVAEIAKIGEDTAKALNILNGGNATGKNEDQSAGTSLESLRQRLTTINDQLESTATTDLTAIHTLKTEREKLTAEIEALEIAYGFRQKPQNAGLSERRQAEIELEKAQAEEAAAIQQSIYEDESKNYAERAIALSKFYDQKRALEEIDYQAAKEGLDAQLAAGTIDQGTYDARLATFDIAKSTAFSQLQRDQQAASQELAQTIADDMLDRIVTAEETAADATATIQKSIYEDESKSYVERAMALTKFFDRKRELIEADYEASKDELDAQLMAGEIDQKQYDDALGALDIARSAAFSQLQRNQQEAGQELAQSVSDGMMQRIATAAENVAKELDASMQSELLAQANKYKQGLIDKEEFEKKKAEIADKYRRQQFEKEISILEEELSACTHSAEDREKLQKELTEKQIEYNQYKNDQQIASDTEAGDAAAEIEKSKASLKMQLLDEVFNFASTLNNAWLEKETERLDEESEANEKWREDEIERIEQQEEQGVISKEQAEARKKQIEDQAAANEEEIEKKRIEAQRKAAIYDKAISAAQVAIATAMAIANAMKTIPTMALIPWIAALGAVQLATILATPIPEYARGTADHGGGLAIVGDGGRSELVLLPDHTMWQTPATDTLVNLPEHAQVLPDYYAAIRELAIPHLNDTEAPMIDVSGILRKLDQTGDKITETNRLFRVSIARADKQSKISNAFLLNNKSAKLWN